MLDVVNRYANGFVAIPVIEACRRGGLFVRLADGQPADVSTLAAALGANEGHLRAALRLLVELSWLEETDGGAYLLTPAAALAEALPEDIGELIHLPLGESLRLESWLARCRNGWKEAGAAVAELLDGVLMAPLLVEIHRLGGADLLEGRGPGGMELSSAVLDGVRSLFEQEGWGDRKGGVFRLTEAGKYLVDSGAMLGTVVSYGPMLRRLDELLFGDPGAVFTRDDAGHERHVERALNVTASGAQHQSYFAEMEDLLCEVFDRLPLEDQPRYVADMGCGDGSLLRRVYDAVRTRTARGAALDRLPLRLIAIDFNERALESAASTLAGLPHLLVHGDSGDPEGLLDELRRQGIADPENVLHVRSFLDHDRTFVPPADGETVLRRAGLPYTGVYVARDHGAIPAAVAIQSLVEHLSRWRPAVSRYGLTLLEVHCLRPPVVRKWAHRTEALHFDAYHAFSGQALVEAPVFLMSAAEAGLFPVRAASRRYPRRAPFTRITLSRFTVRPYRVRHPTTADLPALERLEAVAVAPELRTPAAELRRRLATWPLGQAVLEHEGEIVAALYAQRIDSREALLRSSHAGLAELQRPDGPVVQLLGLCVHPERQGQGLGDELLDFMLVYFSVCDEVERVVGVTRCRDYPRHRHAGLDPEQYARWRDEQGRLVDRMLRFHESHGAVIGPALAGFRPEDSANDGWGVLVDYAVQHPAPAAAGLRPAAPAALDLEGALRGAKTTAIAETVRECILEVLGSGRAGVFSPDIPLMQMGLGSLDLLDLRHLMEVRLQKELDATFFFRHGTAAAVIAHFSGTGEVEPAARAGSDRSVGRSGAVAVIGIGCRFPGGASDPDRFWRLLQEGRDAVVELPEERRQLAGLGSPPRQGGYLSDVAGFDAAFFRVSPREARMLDPQQRLLLEVVCEALERAGCTPSGLEGSATGAFVGVISRDYESLVLRRGRDEDFDAYFSTGNASSVAAGRLAYFFDWRGPTLTVDTACSSSLVAVHLACRSLQAGECGLAVAGGVQLLLAPEPDAAFRRAGMLSPEGRCKTFDASADGYVRGEGCGVVVLKRLEDAERAGDRVLAVIRGSAVNQDGAGAGLTVPNPVSQQALIERALREAGLAPCEVAYLEAHGTGTSLGDPIEVQAAAAALGEGREPERPLLIGSVKTNIGHLEAAAGIAGLIKVVLSLQHGTIPRHLHFREPSPHIPWERLPVRVTAEGAVWPPGRKIAGVSSFGFSGTNAHVVVEEAPAAVRPQAAAVMPERSAHVLPLSARGEEALLELCGRYGEWFSGHPEAALADVAHSAAVGRSPLEERLAVVAATAAEARQRLEAFGRGEPSAGVYRGRAGERPRVAWLFPGQGSQYAGMARELFASQPVFRQVLERCDRALSGEGEGWLLEVLFGPEDGRLDATRYTQPALYAVEVALAAQWREWGLEPDVVLGHSVGEYAAAAVAGIFSVEEGLRLIARRGELMGRLPSGGAMASVLARQEAVEEALGSGLGGLSLAAENGAHVVLSGGEAELESALSRLSELGVRSRRLRTSHAFHSALIEPALAPLEAVAAEIGIHPARCPLVSNLTGRLVGPEGLDEAYWRRQAREPVRFGRGVATLSELGVGVLLEVGPQPVLCEMAARCWPAEARVPALVASLRRGREDGRTVAEALAQLWVHGAAVDFAAWDRPWGRRKLALPTYPFQRRRHWFDDPRPGLQLEPAAAADCLYQVSWRPAEPLAVPVASAEPGGWLLLADGQGWAARLAESLEERGERCRLLCPERWQAEGMAAFESVLDEMETGGVPLRRVVHLWSLDLPPEPGAALESFPRLCLASTLDLVKALVRRSRVVPVHLVTRGAQPAVEGEPVDPFQAPLWGLGRVLGLEQPELWGGLVDLPAAAEPGDASGPAEALLAELLSRSGEDQVALRGGRLVPRLTRLADGDPAPPPELSAEAIYLITGGLGVLGLEAARWLAACGARHLVLVGRRAPGEKALTGFAELERLGCRVEALQADVSRREEVVRLLADLAALGPALGGVVHAAGVLNEKPLLEISSEDLAEVLAAKVQGGWWLHQESRSRGLELFVSFSSVAAVWGGRGQAHYAAANAFLDSLAHCRRTQGLPAVSLDFGPWQEGGMASAGTRARLRQSGVEALTAPQARAAWQRAQAEERAQTVVAVVDWPRFQAVYQARMRRPLLAELAPSAAAGTAMGSRGKTPFVERLERASPAEWRPLLEGRVRRVVAEVLGHEETRIDPRAGFFDLGMDSLMAVELRQRLQAALGCSLPATLAMDRPRVVDLAGHLLEVLGLESSSGIHPALQPARLDEPVAVIGLACRVPGADGAEAFWRLLAAGGDAVGEPPSGRWDLEALYDPDPESPGKIYTRRSGFLAEIDRFDASLFGISPREAASMDPQQRLLLEVAWEALEAAALAPHSLARTRTGVYVGAAANEYGGLLAAGGPEAIDAHFITGNALNVIAGRLAFVLGLEGPAMAVDTACSSSLVALHQACQALRLGECDAALVGGVNLLLSAQTMVAICRARMLSPEGLCKTFDASADGYVRGEGCGVVVLKRLEDAERDGDRVLAVIRGSAVNQDGAGAGLTVPTGPAQERVIREALRQAGIEPREVAYLEAHGTGTSLGDPIEVQAAAAALGEGREPERPLLIGSVKTNIGHLEAAAGIAGLIKVVLSLQHGTIPRHLHFREPSPHIPWERLPVRVTAEGAVWPPGRKIAGVSSFGFSGTNAHVVVEEAPAAVRPQAAAVMPERSAHVLPLSARGEEALLELCGRYGEWFSGHPEAALADVAHSAAVGRSSLEERLAVVAATASEARQRLEAFGRGEPSAGVYRGRAGERPRVAWLFPGQGSQYAGMARELFASQPVFRQVLERCDRALAGEGEGWLLEVLFGPEDGRLDATRYTQPALYAVEVALAAQWREWGLEPDVVLGHSVGEYAAAAVAGIFSVEEGLRLIARRGELMGRLPSGGAMASVLAPQGVVEEALGSGLGGLSLAAENGAHVVLSGGEIELAAALSRLSELGVRSRRLRTSHAFHSALIEPALAPLEAVAAEIGTQSARCPLVSNLTGRLVGPEGLDAAYWRRQAREPVQFGRGVGTLAELGVGVLLEVGPQPVLCEMAARCWPTEAGAPALVASLWRGREDGRMMAEALAQLWVHGAAVDFAAWDRPWGRRKLALPTYPFQRRRYWFETASAQRPAPGRVAHPLLGVRQELATGAVVYTQKLSCSRQPWLLDHQLYQTVVVGGATYVSMALCGGGTPGRVSEVVFQQPLLLPRDQAREVQFLFSPPEDAGRRRFEVHSRPLGEEAAWVHHASGSLEALEPAGAEYSAGSLEALPASLEPWPAGDLFAYYAGLQLELGLAFRAIRSVRRGPGEALAELVVPESLTGNDGGPIHPALLDACTQVTGAVPPAPTDVFYAPLRYERVTLYEPVPERFFCHARLASASGETRTFDLRLLSSTGRLLGGIEGFTLKRAPRQAFLRGLDPDVERLLYRVAWRESQASPAAWSGTAASRWLVLGDRGGVGRRLVEKLRAKGYECRLAAPGEPPGNSFDGVIHLSSLDMEDPERGSGEGLVQSIGESCEGLLALLQGARDGTRSGPRRPRGLWLVTRGAWGLDPAEPPVPGPAAVWGMGRVLQREHPDLGCRLVDLDRPVTEGALEALVAELEQPAGEDQIGLRGDRRLVPRLVRGVDRGSAAVAFSGEATYLLTGGLGGLGLELARWLVERGARHLVLNGRSAPGPAAEAMLAELRERGAQVALLLADVSREAEVQGLLSRIRSSSPPLGGIFHLAGVLRDGALLHQNGMGFQEVLGPKVLGAWHLHAQATDPSLRHFVLFSSAAAVLGNPGQGNYAAANAFLDGLAQYRWTRGLPATSIAWGAWSGAGLAAGRAGELSSRLERSGLGWMEPKEALRALDRVLAAGIPDAAVLAADWPVLARGFKGGGVPPLLSELLAASALADRPAPPPSASKVLSQLQGVSGGDRLQLLKELVSGEVRQVLGLPAPPPPTAGFHELGMDSLLAIDLHTRLRQQLQGRFHLPYTIAFEHPNVVALARYLSDQLGPPAPAAGKREGERELAELLAQLDGLSDEEAERRLLAKLGPQP